jgi:anti-sigma factor RsiW
VIDMDCMTARTRLAAYEAGDLTAKEGAAVQAHLETCPACRVCYEEYRDVDTILRGWQPPSLPEGFARRVTRQLARESGDVLVVELDDDGSGFWQSWWSRFAVAGLAAGLISFLIWLASPPPCQQRNMDELIVNATAQIRHYVAEARPEKSPVLLMFGVVPKDVPISEEVSTKEVLPVATSALVNSRSLLMVARTIP